MISSRRPTSVIVSKVLGARLLDPRSGLNGRLAPRDRWYSGEAVEAGDKISVSFSSGAGSATTVVIVADDNGSTGVAAAAAAATVARGAIEAGARDRRSVASEVAQGTSILIMSRRVSTPRGAAARTFYESLNGEDYLSHDEAVTARGVDFREGRRR